MSARIRPAVAVDTPLILSLIRELAEYERLTHEVDATEDLVRDSLFGPSPRSFCDLAEWQGEPAGFAVWFYSYSTFRGRHGVYLEDLFVRPEHRGRGLGRALLAHLASRCREERLPRLEWSVLDWNEPSIRFYRALGAEPREGWTGFRLSGPALDELGTSSP